MKDLNATVCFKAKFTITANEPSVDLLWTLVYEIRTWLLRKWNNEEHKTIPSDMNVWAHFKSGGKLFDEEKTNHLYGESAYYVDENTNAVSWACKIVENRNPKQGYAPRDWTTEIGYQSSDNISATISYLVTYNDMSGYIGLHEEAPVVSIPRLIRALLSHEKITCSIGPDRLLSHPVLLKAGDYSSFENVIFDPARKIPVIYISSYILSSEDGDVKATLLVDPYQMAKCVTANAIVYYSDQVDSTEEIQKGLEKWHRCSDGAIHLYRPKVNRENVNDHYKHRFIDASFILEHGEEVILNIFRRALAQDVYYYETLFRLDDCKKLFNGK